MPPATFWALIDQAKTQCPLTEDRADWLWEHLVGCPAAEIVGFGAEFEARMAESYQERLWGAAYVINGGCSDDGFDYFRGWLILQGQAAYQAALANPETLADVVTETDAEEGAECELALSIASRAYEAAGHGDIDAFYAQLPPPAYPEIGEFSWQEETVGEAFPRLAEKFGY